MSQPLILILIVVILIMHDCNGGNESYCDLDMNHYLCQPKEGYSPKCNYPFFDEPSEDETHLYLVSHNSLRSRLASGRLTGKDDVLFPKAANMEEMIWDEELAEIAIAKVKTCEMEQTPKRLRYQSMVHENVWENMLVVNIPYEASELYEILDLPKALEQWTDLRMYYDPASVTKYKRFKGNLNSFTAMIWAESKYIGCAKILSPAHDKISTNVIVACYYAPGGNIVGEPVYKIGSPCSACPKNKGECSGNHLGLCSSKIKGIEFFPEDYPDKNSSKMWMFNMALSVSLSTWVLIHFKFSLLQFLGFG